MSTPFELPATPALEQQAGRSFSKLVELMRRLLAPDGCPWDREQSYETLRKYVLEEACEVIDAIDGGSLEELKEELGDLSLQIVFLSELARAEGAFGPDDVIFGICEKLVRRHPHVFGEVDVEDADEVLRNWAAIKEQEKGPRALLDGIPRSLPALFRAVRVSHTVSRVGFDWDDAAGSRQKVSEELAELDEAISTGNESRVAQELGDTLFALVNLARHLGVDPEAALQGTTNEFVERFRHVEERVRAERGGWPVGKDGTPGPGLPLEELDAYWDEAKRSRQR